jgi:hypothetical protein
VQKREAAGVPARQRAGDTRRASRDLRLPVEGGRQRLPLHLVGLPAAAWTAQLALAGPATESSHQRFQGGE